MKKILYVVPDIEKVSGGPRTRISMFKAVFLEKGDYIIEGKGKFKKAFCAKNKTKIYVESATNRISLEDFFSLLYLRLISKEITVFIRDIYIELFPEEYNTLRGKLTVLLNKASNFFLTLISKELAFPTEEMGTVFFEKNKTFPKRKYFPLPPGSVNGQQNNFKVNFEKTLGILYLGGISYPNSGFQHFLDFADKYKQDYNFFVLSGDKQVKEIIRNRNHIIADNVAHNKILNFIDENNIFLAFHSRPRNVYDDLTYPIKVLDYVGMNIPFVTARHRPIMNLLGKDYLLYVNVTDTESIFSAVQKIEDVGTYRAVVDCLRNVAARNSYEERYRRIFR